MKPAPLPFTVVDLPEARSALGEALENLRAAKVAAVEACVRRRLDDAILALDEERQPFVAFIIGPLEGLAVEGAIHVDRRTWLVSAWSADGIPIAARKFMPDVAAYQFVWLRYAGRDCVPSSHTRM